MFIFSFLPTPMISNKVDNGIMKQRGGDGWTLESKLQRSFHISGLFYFSKKYYHISLLYGKAASYEHSPFDFFS